MVISKELFLSILSMDAYNRGYDAGLADQGAGDPDGLGRAGSIFSNVEVLDVGLPTGSEAAGFYAIAYEVTDGTNLDGFDTGDVIISYRGTDNPAVNPLNAAFASVIPVAMQTGIH